MPKGLVIYYSLSGMTRQVAQEIARVGGWDVGEIREVKPRKGAWAHLRSGADALFGSEPPITYAGPDPAGYDFVILGTPVWVSRIASPVRSFMKQYASKLPRVGLLLTFGSAGGSAVRQFSTLCGKPPVYTLLVPDAEISSGSFHGRVEEFVHKMALGQASSTR